MAVLSDDPEDIRAALRKKHGTLTRFERARGLPLFSARDVLRGRAVQRTATAIAEELGTSVEVLFPGRFKSHNRDDSAAIAETHRQNAGGR